MINQSTKILCTTLILSFTMQSSFAMQNYVVTTTVNDNYSSSSPVGRFENYSSNGAVVPSYTVGSVPTYNYQPSTISYGVPVYSAGATYSADTNASQNYSVQDIQAPQEYNRTTTTTEQYVDTRETADKVIDRGVKIAGALAVVGAVAGLIIGVCK